MINLISFCSFSGEIYVKHDATGNNDGTSWTDAFTDLQPAIDSASVGDEVWVAAGTYLPTSWPNGGSATNEKHFSLKNGVGVYGGFAGDETQLTDRDSSTNITTLSGDFNDDDTISGNGVLFSFANKTENADRVFSHTNGVNLLSTAILDGFTIKGGGAGIYNDSSSPTIKNCIFTENDSSGIYNTSSSPAISNCTFSHNFGINYPYGGGAICNLNSSPTIVYCNFSENYTSNDGGGISNYTSSPTIGNSVFLRNFAESNGGGISNTNSFVTISDCTFTENHADYLDGGGIHCLAQTSSSSEISNCTFIGNSATSRGGGIYIYNGTTSDTTIIANCTFKKNTADNQGGGISFYCSGPFYPTTITDCSFIENQSLKGGGVYNSTNLSKCMFYKNIAADQGGGVYASRSIVNCSFVNNTAYKGGGIANDENSTENLNCTLIGNSAHKDYGGGGIYNGSSSAPIIKNTILWDNGGAEYEISNFPGFPAASPSVSYCIIEGGYASGTNIITGDPSLQQLHDNGGNIKTLAIPDDSYAVDAGTATGAPSTDARGISRPQGGGIDIGAYENNGALTSQLDISPASIDFGQVYLENEVVTEKIIVRGSLLSNDVSVSAPSGFEVSLDEETWSSSMSLPITSEGLDTDLYIRFKPTLIQNYNDTVDFSSGSSSNSLSITGEGIAKNVIYVSPDGDNSDGSSWSKAYNDLQNAIDSCSSNAEIWVKTGTYKPTSWPNGGSTANEKHFSLKNGVSIYGGFAGTETLLSQRDYNTYQTILSGDVNGDDNVSGSGSTLSLTNGSDNTDIVLFHPAGISLDKTALIDGFTIKGGGLIGCYNGYSSPNIKHCSFLENWGAMRNDSSAPSITGCSFTRNSADYPSDDFNTLKGGGVYNYNSSPILRNCSFAENFAYYNGGGIYNDQSSPTITGCNFTENHSNYDGGGISNKNFSSPVLTECTFSNNTAVHPSSTYDGQGGGMHNESYSSPILTDCTFSNNSASGYAGGGYNDGNSSPSFLNCTFSENSSPSGGGVANLGGSPVFVNNTFSDNSADDIGGAILNFGSSAIIINCTLSGNSAVTNGGGIYNNNNDLILTNTILWNNGGADKEILNNSATPTVTNCVVEGGYASGTNIITADPQLDSGLKDNGGPTKTLAILSGSSAIDAGTTSVPSGIDITTDQRGYFRSGLPDIGAYEKDTCHTLTYIAGTNGSIIGDSPQLVEYGSDGTEVSAVPDPGYHFVDWSDSSTDNPRTDTNITAQKTVIANFAINTYTLTYNAGANGSITGTTPQTINHGSDGTAVTATPDAGYHFVEWSDGVKTASRTDTNITADLSVTANFVENILTVSIGSASISENGETATATVTRNSGTTGDLIVNLASDDTTEAIVPASVTIPDGSSSVDFTVTAVDDNTIDGNPTVTITATANNHIAGNDTLTVADDDTPGFSVDPTSLTIEEGNVDTFGVVLTAEPDSDVVLTINSSNTADATVDKATLTFTPGNWDTPQTVTVTAVDNSENGAGSSTITVSVDNTISDDNFDPLADQTVTVSVSDDDPTAVDDTVIAGISTSEVISVLDNDTDPQGDGLTVAAITSAPSVGTAEITDSGNTITYTAPATSGTVTFDYQISDGNGGVSEATVTVTVGKEVAYGLCFTVKASEAGLTQFIKRPKITANYTDPIKNKAMKAAVKILTKVPSVDGSVVTEVDCEWKRSVLLYNKKTLAAAYKTGTYTSTYLTSHPLETLICSLNVQATQADGTKMAQDIDKKLILAAPEITDVEKWDGTALGTDPVQFNGVIVLKGKYFGVKAPKAWMEYIDAKGKLKKQRLMVQKIFNYADAKGKAGKSCMDITTGDSEIRVQLPKKWWKGWVAKAYDLVIDNKVGMTTTSIVTADGSNTVPTVTADTFDVTAGEKCYLLDVLANDSDAESDFVNIVFPDKTTNQFGKVRYDKKTGKVKYTPPKDKVAPYTDTFKYTLDDGHSAEGSWPTEVTVTINVN